MLACDVQCTMCTEQNYLLPDVYCDRFWTMFWTHSLDMEQSYLLIKIT